MDLLMRIRMMPVLGVILLLSCSKSQPVDTKILVAGHGGSGFPTYRNPIPPNTLESVTRGYFIEGADAVEMDLQMTADSGIVLFHDELLQKGCDCEGCISTKTTRDILHCRMYNPNGLTAGEFHFRRIEEILDTLKNSKAILFLNTKSHDPCAQDSIDLYRHRFVRNLARILDEKQMTDRVYVETLDTAFLDICRRQDARIRVIYDDEDFDRAQSVCFQKGYEGFAISNARVNASQVAQAQSNGLLLIIWGVKTTADSRKAVEKQPDVIMTDDILMLRSLL